MAGIADTIRQLRAIKMGAAPDVLQPSSRLQRLDRFGSNPGALNGWFYAGAPTGSLALVVVLHGCTQTAAAYDHGSGWSELAARHGFAVLFPEQQRTNNHNLCFNWFREADARRDAGEALSIKQMIDAVARVHAIDPDRIFVTGLSAGGAMAGVMLATYPELFAGGSIIAGLPYGAAASLPEALERMRGAGHATAPAYAAAVRRASAHPGPWPRVTVWHGDADHIVSAVNADLIVDQWRTLHAVRAAPDLIEFVDGHPHRSWCGVDGVVVVDEYRIAGFGHGTPLKTVGADSCGNAGAYMLEAGISSTWRQAESWGLVNDILAGRAGTPSEARPSSTISPAFSSRTPFAGVNATIEQALQAAGLMR